MVLTYMDCMTRFASAFYLGKSAAAEHLATIITSTFFANYGLPRVIVVDDGNEFKAEFKKLFNHLMIPVVAVAKKNHKAVVNERLHRYLNKVQQINSADTSNLFQ